MVMQHYVVHVDQRYNLLLIVVVPPTFVNIFMTVLQVEIMER